MNASTPELSYRLTNDGAFICGDKQTGVTAYAYPTSESAHNAAHGHAIATAMDMLARENAHIGRNSLPDIDKRDLRHWWIINAGDDVPVPDYLKA